MRVIIAVDGMGGDHAPEAVVQGSLEAAKDPSLHILLVGPGEKLRQQLSRHPRASSVEVVPASQVITMEEGAASALRSKPDSSMAVAIKLVKSGRAQAFVTAGNSGAAMALSAYHWGVVPGIERPALAAILPTRRGKVVLLDAGANVDCSPSMLCEFAILGAAYARTVLEVKTPRVALFSIGEETSKGNAVCRQAYRLLSSLSPQNSFLEFIGNTEGTQLYHGLADVVVCDGFVGNAVLKTSEGVAEFVVDMMKRFISSSKLALFGSLFTRPALRRFLEFCDYAEYGGAPLLGVQGVCIVAHGRSNATAIANAIRVAALAVTHNLVPNILEGVDLLAKSSLFTKVKPA